MHKTITTMIASMATAILLTVSSAHATVYKFTLEFLELRTDGDRRHDGRHRRRGTGDFGRDFRPGRSDHRLDHCQSELSGPAYSPDGLFIYNNLYHPSGLALDVYGVLFATPENPGGYWNLWGNSQGNYSLWELASSSGYPIEESGTLSVAAVPELSTWAMLGLGFAGLGGRWPGAAPAGGEPRLDVSSHILMVQSFRVI